MQAIFVINLAHRLDRRCEMVTELARVGWREVDFFQAIRPDDRGEFDSIGARGCFLSHLEVLRLARMRGLDQLILLEDDVNFVNNFPTRWSAVLACLEQRDWSIFYGGHVLGGAGGPLLYIDPTTSVRCAHFMMIRKSAIDLLVRGLETILSRPKGHPLGGPMHVDGAYSTIRLQNPELNTYGAFPVLGYQRASRTDIADQKWFDKIRAFDPAVRMARNIKSLIKRH
jgi:glycosyl transferase, family 25